MISTAAAERLYLIVGLVLGIFVGVTYAYVLQWAEKVDKNRQAWLATLDDKAYRRYQEMRSK